MEIRIISVIKTRQNWNFQWTASKRCQKWTKNGSFSCSFVSIFNREGVQNLLNLVAENVTKSRSGALKNERKEKKRKGKSGVRKQ
jgi:hypothetical protein